MYQDYWQLDSKPFDPVDDAAWFFPSEPHRGALLKLRYAVEQKRGAAVLAGPSGVGKTLLVDRLVEELDDSVTPVARVVFPQMTERDLLAYLADRLGAPAEAPPRYTVDESVRRLETLLATNRDAGRHALLVIDEAHLLDDTGLLETARLLLNLGGGDGGGAAAPAMTLLLVGQMGVLSALERTPSLEERVAVKSLLRSFTVDETAEYVRHRLRAAGATRELFSPDALQLLHPLTGGVARRVDRLCDLALVVGFADSQATIDATHLESISRELLSVAPE